jgi:hypothetical protein
MRAIYVRSNGKKYVPLDELLEAPRVRILRALRRLQWVESVDIFEALGDVLHSPRVINNYTTVLLRLVRDGWIKRREIRFGRAGGRYEYAITLRGRVELQGMLDRASPEVELGVLPDDWVDTDTWSPARQALHKRIAMSHVKRAYRERTKAAA